eukprot:3023318-Lingulodinium_polyedra.AAC.1
MGPATGRCQSLRQCASSSRAAAAGQPRVAGAHLRVPSVGAPSPPARRSVSGSGTNVGVGGAP